MTVSKNHPERCGRALIRKRTDAEQCVIGAILLNADEVMPACVEILDEEDFLTAEYRNLYQACCGYFIDGKPIDHVILGAQFGSDYYPVIAACVQSIPSVRNWQSYADIVRQTARRHRAYEKALDLVDALVGGDELQTCQDIALLASSALSDNRADNSLSAPEGFAQFYTALQKPVEYIKTGFDGLDKNLYLERGDYVVIGARPSVGKTALTLQMLMNISRTYTAVYFSLETNGQKLFARMAANVSKIPLSQIKQRSGFDFAKLSEASKHFRDLKFHTVNAAGWSVAEIKAKAVQLGADIIMVDYIGLIRAEGKSPYERMTNTSIALHTMAQSSGITVIAIAQLNREGTSEPDMTHLRESGQIEQDADAILLLRAPDGVENRARKVRIAKNKEGEVGDVSLVFDGEIQRFSGLEAWRNEYS